MRTKGLLRVALMMGSITFGTAALGAAEVQGPDNAETHEVRVVNNFSSPVRVYAQDANGHLHNLGRVSRGQFKVLELSAEVAEMGEVRLKIYPNEPAHSLTGNADGIKTRPLAIAGKASVTMLLESDLTQSMITVEQG